MSVRSEGLGTMMPSMDEIPPPPSLSPEVASSTATSIHIRWAVSDLQPYTDSSGPIVIEGFRVHYQKVASTYVQYSHLLPPSAHSYSISNLVADTYYKVCVVMYRNDTASPDRQCVDASTTSWHIPVSIGSSIGALLALSIIVLIVLLSRCPSLIRPQRTTTSDSSKYDSMSSHFPDDHNECSDTTMQCHDHDDDVFSDSYHEYSLEYTKHHHHHSDRLCNGNKNHTFGEKGEVGAGSGVHTPTALQQHLGRTSLGTCGRTQSLTERSRPHHARRAQLLQLHSAHHSIQSEPPALTPRHIQVSISDLPPAVHISDPEAPVSSLNPGAAAVIVARSKFMLKEMPRTFHMSIENDV